MLAKQLLVGCIRALFAVLNAFPQRKTIAFLSRQSPRPFDFQLLQPELHKRFPGYETKWACVAEIGKLHIGLFIKQLYLVATAEVCLVDGYVPAVSIPTHHRGICIQLWHASGAIKKFGYQCLDTPAGRTSADAQVFCMHKGYDYIIAGMRGAQEAFVQAFYADKENVLTLGLPRMDYLLNPIFAQQRIADTRAMYEQLGIDASSQTKIVLYAPTFRKGNGNPQWLEENIQALSVAFAGQDVLLVVAGHPLQSYDQGQFAYSGSPVRFLHGPTVKALGVADIVISDYSAVALDAGLLGKRTLFYVPDIEEYRLSPGLNIDPEEMFRADSFTDAHELAQAAQDSAQAGVGAFRSFIGEYAGNIEGSSIEAICQLVSSSIDRVEHRQ